ncbi:MAG: beta-ketoacyl-ACP reductase [Acidobacteria bacterium]|nr:MAG: beta-ketoacyl-ACP reductase [Acidobacteriota bacterium]
MIIDLSGKKALVTGASRGIGKRCAIALARAGADVTVGYHRKEQEAADTVRQVAENGREATAFSADVTDAAQVEALVQHHQEVHGRLDILVNNAGVAGEGLVGSLSDRDWDHVQSVNLRGAFVCTRAVLPLMMPRGSGKIINMASIVATRSAPGQANYAASKGGLVAFTRASAVELATKGIQVNAILPGLISNGMSAKAQRRYRDRMLDRIPAGRFGKAEEVAQMVVYLASSAADYITGQSIVIDGGLSVA